MPSSLRTWVTFSTFGDFGFTVSSDFGCGAITGFEMEHSGVKRELAVFGAASADLVCAATAEAVCESPIALGTGANRR